MGRLARDGASAILALAKPVLRTFPQVPYADNRFRLLINGAGYRLLEAGPQDGQQRIRYYVEDNPSMLVYNHNGYYGDGTNCTYWTVRTGDGVQYRLGYDSRCAGTATGLYSDAVSYQHIQNNYLSQSNPGTSRYIVLSWHVDTITDANGNQITFYYDRPAGTECPSACSLTRVTTHSSRLQEVRYNFNTRITSTIAHNVARLSDQANVPHATRIKLTYYPAGLVIDIRHGDPTGSGGMPRSIGSMWWPRVLKAMPTLLCAINILAIAHGKRSTWPPKSCARLRNKVMMSIQVCG